MCSIKISLRRRIGFLLAGLLATTALVSIPVTPASASIYYVVIKNLQTGRCLDSNYNGNVYTLRCNGGNYQNWIVATYDYTIRDAQTGRCLDSNYNGNVYTLRCNGGNYQKWYPEGTIEAAYTWMRDGATGRELDSNYGGSVYTLPRNTGNYQKWMWLQH
jgi:hypothetical protein